jgi:YfiH family protein
MWLKSPNINCIHGFSTRHGGVSEAPYGSLNFGGSGDFPENISQNRKLALKNLGVANNQLCYLNQVHGNTVCFAKIGAQTGDALVTNLPNYNLAIGIADCYAILFYDETNKIIGAAHAGWRGTVSKIARNTLLEMQKLGANISKIQVAIGQGISQNKFEVGHEVIAQFEHAGFNNKCWNENKIDLIQCNLEILLKSGVTEKNIWCMKRCTFEEDFFSYRRDKGQTGRMWAIISL